MSIRQDGKIIAGTTVNPCLFDVKWADHILNDVSWLRADTFSWQSGAVYQAAYQHLADDIDGKTLQSETISGTTIQFYLADDGHKICPASEESNVVAIYNATGVAWYYIIDTVNERFKLPRTKFGLTGLRDTVGNYVTPGLPNITGYMNGVVSHSGNTSTGGAFSHTDTADLSYTGGGSAAYYLRRNNLNLNASSSSSIYGASSTVQPQATQMYLYFYVGNFTQTALENTAGLNTELFNDKADKDFGNTTMIDYVVEKQEPTSSNNYTWYRKYKSGWVEQGGIGSNTAGSSGFRTINFPIIMSNTNYTATGIVYNSEDNGIVFHIKFGNMTTTKMEVMTGYSGNKWGYAYGWQVSGMAA